MSPPNVLEIIANGNVPPKAKAKFEITKLNVVGNVWENGFGWGSVRCAFGLGGIHFFLGSSDEDPRPYKGITFWCDMAALHTGHTWLFGFVSSHWWRHGQQNRWPHIEMTAFLAVSKQILHSNAESKFSSPGLSVFVFDICDDLDLGDLKTFLKNFVVGLLKFI